MALGWSKSFSASVKKKTGFDSSKPRTTGSNTSRASISSSSKSSSSSKPKISQSSNFIATATPSKISLELKKLNESNQEKYARLQAEAKEREDNIKKQKEIQQGKHVAELYDIHAKKIAGITPEGSTANTFINNKTGETSQKASDVTSVNLEAYLGERGYGDITETFTFGSKTNTMPDILKPQKLNEERMASKTREEILRNQAEIKARGGTVPELNLMNKEQVDKYNEISNVISQSKPDNSEKLQNDIISKVSNFLSLDNPITQKPKTRGESEVFATGIEDSTVESLGFSPEAFGDKPKTEQTDEDKKFVTKDNSVGIAGIGLGLGALGLIYFLSRRK